MADGTKKPLGDIVVGDRVLAYDKASKKAVPTDVVAVPFDGYEECFRITTSDGSWVEATADHEFLIDTASGSRGRHSQVAVQDIPKRSGLVSPDVIEFIDRTKRVQTHTRKPIKDISSVGYKPVRCITVAHPDHLFLVNDYIVTSNTGKSLAGSAEAVFHITGRYPSWWQGLRLERPKNVWVIGESLGSIREALMEYYLGGNNEADFGTGFIPKSQIVDWGWNRHAANVIDYVLVKHKAGHNVRVVFKSYEQGRKMFQSAKIDFIHCDEEPPIEVFAECAARIMGTGGGMIVTATPLKGQSDVYYRHTEPSEENAEFYGAVVATIYDNPFISEEEKRVTISGYEEHQLQARIYGIPSKGSGLVYPFNYEDITCKPFEIPEYWDFGFGMDFGKISNAVVAFARDPNTKTVYIYHTIKTNNLSHGETQGMMKEMGFDKMRGVGDPAGRIGSQTDGRNVLAMYAEAGFDIEVADNSVETGLSRVYQMFKTGRLKIFDCHETQPLMLELRRYHRNEKGDIVKRDDHVLDALRYAMMSGLNRARPLNFMKKVKKRIKQALNWKTV